MIVNNARKLLGILITLLVGDTRDSDVRKYSITTPFELSGRKAIIFCRRIRNDTYEEYISVLFDDVFESLKEEYGSSIYKLSDTQGWHLPVKEEDIPKEEVT